MRELPRTRFHRVMPLETQGIPVDIVEQLTAGCRRCRRVDEIARLRRQ